MNVRDFQKWLDRFPDDTIVEVVVGDEEVTFAPEATESDPLASISEGWDFHDFTKPPSLARESSPYRGKRILVLGERE